MLTGEVNQTESGWCPKTLALGFSGEFSKIAFFGSNKDLSPTQASHCQQR